MAEKKTENGLVVGLILPEPPKEDKPVERSSENVDTRKTQRSKRNDSR